MVNLERPRRLIKKEKIEITDDRNEGYVREKLKTLGMQENEENIGALSNLISMGSVTGAMLEQAINNKNPSLITKSIERYKKWYEIAISTGVKEGAPLTDEEANVAVKFLNEIKSRFRKEAKGEKPREYLKSFWQILRDYNITLRLDDIDSPDNFSVNNKINDAELRGNIERLVNRGITDTDGLFKELSEFHKGDKDENWKKHLVQKHIRKWEIAEYLKIYPNAPKHFLKHHTLPKRILKRALYRELLEMAEDKEEKRKKGGNGPTESMARELKKGDKPTELPEADKIFYGIIKGLRKKDLGE